MSNTSTKTIVLVDDEQFIAMAYKDGLQRAGYTVHVAADGEEGLVLVKGVKPDLLLLDLMMPKKNGFDVLRELKANDELKAIPVIVLSNLSQATDEREVRALGAIDFIVKSDISLEDLLDKIKPIFA